MSRGKDTRRELELAGIDVEQLGDFFRPRGITVTDQVELVESDKGHALQWPNQYELDIDRLHTRDTSGALDAFIRLEGAPPDRFLRFAREWGPLGLCEQHGLPLTHNRPTYPHAPADYHCIHMNPEPIDSWQHFVRQAAALARILGHLARGERPSRREWQIVYEWSRAPRPAPWWNPTLDADRMVFSEVLREWVELADLRPVPSLWTDEPRVELMFDLNLFGAVARDLLFLAVGRDRLATCWECGALYAPKRRCAPGRRAFCARCREQGAPSKHSSRDYRTRQKS